MRKFFLFVLCCVFFQTIATEQTSQGTTQITLNEVAWGLILRARIDIEYEKDPAKRARNIKKEMHNVARCCKFLNKIVKDLASNDSFNNYFISQLTPTIKFENSDLNDVGSKKMLAAAHIGTPSALKTLEKQLKEGPLTSIKLFLDAKCKPRKQLVSWYWPCSNVCGGQYETTVSIAEALTDVLKNFPKTTQLFCHKVLKERQKATPSFAKTYSVSSELDKLAAAYDEQEQS